MGLERYFQTTCLSETLELLARFPESARLIAGGTDLVIAMRSGEITPETLIDIGKVGELNYIKDAADYVLVGPLVTFTQLERSPVVKQYVPLLHQAASEMGSPQIRNRGTVGGNLINGSPAADSLPPLVAMDARVMLASAAGERQLLLTDIYQAPYRTTLEPGELLREIRIPKIWPRSSAVFIKVGRRNALAISRLSVAISLNRKDNRVEDPRVVVGAVLPKPQRLREVEAVLKDQVLDKNLLQGMAEKVQEVILTITGKRNSSRYKLPVAGRLLQAAAQKAWEEAGQFGQG